MRTIKQTVGVNVTEAEVVHIASPTNASGIAEVVVSALNVNVAGGLTVSGGVTVSGGIQVSGTVSVSGVVSVSGNAVQNSGQSVNVIALNNIRVSGSPLTITGASGGIALPNVTSKSVLVTNHSGNADMYLGSATDVPYSGFGYMFMGSTSVSVDVANPSTVLLVATTSGQKASYVVVMA